MGSEAQRYIKTLLMLWILSIAVVFMGNADALVLGDIQVISLLGQPLNARIALIDLSDADVLKFNAGMAGLEDYKKLDLQYPAGYAFRFALFHEPGVQPYINVSTKRPVDDPFVNLLVEVSYPAGKVVKSYTFLLDPVSLSQAVPQNSEPLSAVLKSGDTTVAGSAAPVKISAKRKKHHGRVKKALNRVVRPAQHGKSHLQLTMSLSISGYDPSVPVSQNSDALQEELISKQKMLEDLKLQISAMQGVISGLNDKQTASSVVSSEVVTPRVEAPKPVAVRPAAPVVQPVLQPALKFNWQKPAIALGVLILLLSVLFWYRKGRVLQAQQQGIFDDLDEVHFETTMKVPVYVPEQDTSPAPAIAEQTVAAEKIVHTPAAADSPQKPELLDLTFGEESIEMPAYTAPIVPPEYPVLMGANRYLRAGNDKLAEEAFIRAIEINPKNSYGYLALLKVYEKSEDVKRFEAIARQLKEVAGQATFESVAEIGRKLDPDNPLYA